MSFSSQQFSYCIRTHLPCNFKRLLQLVTFSNVFLRRSLMISIIRGFRTIIFIFIVISTIFRLICPPAFFKCLSNSGTFKELRTMSLHGVTCSAITGYKCYVFRYFNSPAVRLNLLPTDDCLLRNLGNQRL